MMKVVKYDPSGPGKGRSRSSLGIQNKNKIRKKSDNHLKLIENTKPTSPIMFHHVRADEMTNISKQDQFLQNGEGHGDEGKKSQQNPLVIKTDPRYNNSQLEVSMSNKKLHDYAKNKGKKLTFLPSITNRLPPDTTSRKNIGSDKFSNLGIVNFKGTHELKDFKNGLFDVRGSSLGGGFTDERSHSGPELGTSDKFADHGCLTELTVLGRKFSSDVRLKLNSKNNSQLQNIQGYSTFRVKMNGKNRIGHKDYG